jgi:DNA sulfur modification protein DndB
MTYPQSGSASLLTEVVAELEHNTDAEAREAARDSLATSSGAVMFPCVVFRQGGRLGIATAFPMSFIAQHVRPEPAKKGADPRTATNRPLMPDHVKSIADYLRANRERYILPPVTLNVREMPQVHVQRSNVAVRSGYLVIPHETVFSVTDGMHRVAAIAGYDGPKGNRAPGVLDEHREELSKDGVAVVIIVEKDLSQVHQDFADAAHSKPIPASLLAAYNTREPVNQVLHEVVRNSIFKDRIDETSKTLSKLSSSMFLLNQVRSMIKGLLVGDYAVADASLERQASHRFRDPAIREEFVAQTVEMLTILAENMAPWPTISKLRPNSTAANQILELRPKYLNLTASGLGIIGQVAFAINKRPEAERKPLYLALAKEIDWRRTAEIWAGNVVSSDGKLTTNRHAVDGATNAVKAVLRLPLTTADETA